MQYTDPFILMTFWSVDIIWVHSSKYIFGNFVVSEKQVQKWKRKKG